MAEIILGKVIPSINGVEAVDGNIDVDANHMPYDNTVSELTATKVQGAIDELKELNNSLDDEVDERIIKTGDSLTGVYLYNNSWATNVLTAIGDSSSGGTGIKIKTNISSGHRIVAYIKYYLYGASSSVVLLDLIVSFRTANGTFYSLAVVDKTNINPEVRVALEGGSAVIHIDISTNNPHALHVDVLSANSLTSSLVSRWEMVYEDIDIDAISITTVPYYGGA